MRGFDEKKDEFQAERERYLRCAGDIDDFILYVDAEGDILLYVDGGFANKSHIR